MRKCKLLYAACLGGAIAAGFAALAHAQAAHAASSPFPLQLEARVPFEPAAFPSGRRTYICYELYLTNFSASPVTLSRIDVLDADEIASKPVATIAGDQLDAVLEPFAARGAGGATDARILAPGTAAVAFMWIPFDDAARVPGRLRHRIVTADAAVEGAVIGTHHTELHVLAPPVQGAGWTASDGPSNARDNHHRRGVLVMNGQLVDSRRYAIDWMRYKDGASIAYGESVFAVADATVVKVQDGLPDNVPAPVASFHPAAPITLETAGGNTVLLDLGGGQYAWYFHLKPGSLLVKAGDHVHRGQPLAQIGVSGDSNVPHLHFEVSTSTSVVAGEGVPYLIDSFRIWTTEKLWEARSRELPLDGARVDFGNRSGSGY